MAQNGMIHGDTWCMVRGRYRDNLGKRSPIADSQYDSVLACNCMDVFTCTFRLVFCFSNA